MSDNRYPPPPPPPRPSPLRLLPAANGYPVGAMVASAELARGFSNGME